MLATPTHGGFTDWKGDDGRVTVWGVLFVTFHCDKKSAL